MTDSPIADHPIADRPADAPSRARKPAVARLAATGPNAASPKADSPAADNPAAGTGPVARAAADSPDSARVLRPKWLRGLLEYGPLAIFLAGFLLFRNADITIAGRQWQGLVAATALFIPAQVLATAAMWRLSGRLQAMQVITLVLVVGLGGITLWLSDPAWIKMKPTFLYLLLAVVLAVGLAMGKSWLGVAFGGALQMVPQGWRILTLRFIALCLALALANEVVWRTMSEGFWLGFKLAVLPLAIFGFMMANYRLIQHHQAPDPTAED